MNRLSTPLGKQTLKNPVLAASGCFGYGLEFAPFYDIATLGGICTKGLSLEPLRGSPPDRVCETSSGMLNAIGLANIGVEAFCRDKLPALRAQGAAVIANIFAANADELVRLAERLSHEQGIFALELNVSSPNPYSGVEFGKDPLLCGRLTERVRRATELPLWVKMTPEAGNVVEVARACESAGADAICAINTMRAMSLDINTRSSRLRSGSGGLSGPALKPIALRIVWDLAHELQIPVIGIGGIFTVEDAIEFLLAGASAVQVGTANFVDPYATKKIVDALHAYCAKHEIFSKDLVGKGH